MSFKKVRGKTVYCITFEKTITNGISKIDTRDFPEIFDKIDYNLEACGICIETTTAEQLRKMNLDGITKAARGFGQNEVCLLFYDTRRIDTVISMLIECKENLAAKINARNKEEYRKKYYGKVVQICDLFARSNAR